MLMKFMLMKAPGGDLARVDPYVGSVSSPEGVLCLSDAPMPRSVVSPGMVWDPVQVKTINDVGWSSVAS